MSSRVGAKENPEKHEKHGEFAKHGIHGIPEKPETVEKMGAFENPWGKGNVGVHF
ncbi:MAG: hypothetical protein HY751_02310 [Nitrospinae bacterium]|nr:hypothetical protein [Nitrospinota bacterium]